MHNASHNKKILILGKTGMLGSMVYHYLKNNSNHEVHATVRQQDKPMVKIKSLNVFSFLEKSNKYKYLHEYDYIINCIGIIKPYCRDGEMHGVYEAIKVNALFPHELQHFCKKTPVKIIQIATDCVYAGTKGNYVEDARHDALDVYGKSKSLGEVIATNFLNIRCSIIGPETKNKVSLLEWFLHHPGGSTLSGYSHHFWNGVTTLQFAKLCEVIINNNLFDELTKVNSVHHFVPNQNISKYELLRIFKKTFNKDYKIKKTSTETVNRTLATNYTLLENVFPKTTMAAAIKELAEYMKRYRFNNASSS